MSTSLRFLPVLWLMLSSQITAAATISVDDLESKFLLVALRLEGEIKAGDAQTLANLALRLKEPIVKLASERHEPHAFDLRWLTVTLNSDGGSVLEALKIGRFLREQNAEVRVQYSPPYDVDGYCRSSCVLILIAGATRIYPKPQNVQVHRPYLRDAELGTDFEGSYRRLRADLENYFAEMHVPLAFLDLIYSVPPSTVRRLTHDDLFTYVPLYDPVYEEKQTTAAAEKYGITNIEYRKRLAVIRECPIGNDYVRCSEAILWGISESEFVSRNARARQICSWDSLSRRSEKLGPLACYSHVMRGGVYQ